MFSGRGGGIKEFFASTFFIVLHREEGRVKTKEKGRRNCWGKKVC